MTSEGFVFHSSTYTNDPLNSLPKEDPTCTSSTLNELPMIWNANGISSGYGLVMSPGTYPPPSICQPNLFDQASTRSFPICYGEIAETIQDERSAFQNPYVAAQSVSQSLGDDLDELLPVSSYLSYPPPPPSLQPSVSSNDLNPSDLQDWFASIDGGSDDTWFSSFLFGDLDDSIGAENPSVPGNYPMEATNCVQNGFYSLIDFLTFVPGTSNVPDVENPNPFHAIAESVPQLEYTDVVASGIQTPQSPSVSTPVTDAMHATDGLIKPCPKGYRVVPAPPMRYWAGLSPNLCVYFLRDPSANTQYHCSVDRCTDTFTEKEIGNHLRAKHYGIEVYDDVTCKECGRTVHAKSYQDHFLQLHSERSIHCAYCNSRQVRVQNLPRHFNACPGLDKYWKDRKTV